MTPSRPDPVAVIGASGALGFGLAVRLARTGVPIAIGSRDATRAEETADRAGSIVPDGSFSAHGNAEAVRAASTVILSVPFRNQSETLTNLKQALEPGQLLIDATVPLAAAVGGKATRMLGVWQGSAAQQALELAPVGVRVVSALHTVSAASLTDLQHPLDQDVLVCGDDPAAKEPALEIGAQLVLGHAIDAGPLANSRALEGMTAVILHVNRRYRVVAGLRLTGLP